MLSISVNLHNQDSPLPLSKYGDWVLNMPKSIEGFSGMKKVAGRKWFKGFMSRYVGLTLKLPKLLSVYRAKCANRDVLNGWFDVYESVLEEKGINAPINIWNIDECGCI